MITKRQLEVYDEYAGDIDGWLRGAGGNDKDQISAEEWRTIAVVLQRMRLLEGHLLTEELARDTHEAVERLADGPQTVELLWRMARESGRGQR